MDTKLYFDLLELLEEKDRVIERQSQLIAELVKEKLEECCWCKHKEEGL